MLMKYERANLNISQPSSGFVYGSVPALLSLQEYLNKTDTLLVGQLQIPGRCPVISIETFLQNIPNSWIQPYVYDNWDIHKHETALVR